jgi:hypothetical protein
LAKAGEPWDANDELIAGFRRIAQFRPATPREGVQRTPRGKARSIKQMVSNRQPDPKRMRAILKNSEKFRQKREKTYREKALKLFPWVCARCGREFSGKRLRELTVHHKDHNHDHNPPDGSNWELLCIYCHDYEHARFSEEVQYGEIVPGGEPPASSGFNNPFADLGALLKGDDGAANGRTEESRKEKDPDE